LSKAKGSEQQGILIILSAPSGCGKTTIVDRLLKRHPDWSRSISATTRPPRTGEKKDEDYFFVDSAAFKGMEERGELLESAKVFDYFYGTPKQFITDSLKKGKTLVLAIDVQGMRKIKKVLEGRVPLCTIFVLPPSIKVLRDRLEGRKTDSLEEIERRITAAQEEIKDARLYDFTVMNKNLEQTVLEIEGFVSQKKKERRTENHAIRSS
jgi:guanylate kinase